jgi:hypothetical protein
MDALAKDLKELSLRGANGSFTTVAQRHVGLQLMARQLRSLGYKLPGASNLKTRHIEALVTLWRDEGQATGTIKNRLGWLRWWAAKVRKQNVVPRENAALGVARRQAFKGNRAHTSTAQQLAPLPVRVQLAVRLQLGFGLRLEESLKLIANQADRGNRIALQGSWCKGGRAREVSIVHPRQRALLDEVKAVCGTGSLVPEGASYIAFRKQVEQLTLAADIRNMHGHRHWYAQWRYKMLTGRPSPAAGGDTYERLSRTQQLADRLARLQISAELGHGRLEITDTYLGRRFASHKAAA